MKEEKHHKIAIPISAFIKSNRGFAATTLTLTIAVFLCLPGITSPFKGGLRSQNIKKDISELNETLLHARMQNDQLNHDLETQRGKTAIMSNSLITEQLIPVQFDPEIEFTALENFIAKNQDDENKTSLISKGQKFKLDALQLNVESGELIGINSVNEKMVIMDIYETYAVQEKGETDGEQQ